MKQIVRDTISLLKIKERRALYSYMLFNVIINILDIAALAFLVIIIGLYTQPAGQSAGAIKIFLSGKDPIIVFTIFLFFFILKNTLAYFLYQQQFKFVYKVAARMSRANLVKYFEGSYSNYVKTDSSVHIRKISQQPVEFCHYVLAGLQLMFTELVLISLTILAVFIYNPALCLLVGLLLTPPLFAVSFFIKKKLKKVRADIKTSAEKTLQYLNEALGAYIESNIYDRRLFFVDRYSGFQEALNKHLSELQSAQGITSRLIEIFAVLGMFVLILYNKYAHAATADLINVGAFMVAAYKIIPGMVKISNTSGQIKTYRFTIDDLLEANKTGSKQTSFPTEKIKSVSYSNVGFSQHDHPVLNKLNIEINQGDLIGIKGASGKGKTTFVNLLLGFLEPEQGTISINGNVENSMARQQHWPHISYVKQQNFLIYDSILNNIILGEAKYNEQKLTAALSHSGLSELLEKNAEGLAKKITENGKNISGGQRQRICIARAFYKDADLMIFDEPFNELDNHSAIKILNHLKKLSEEGKIIILITHNSDHLSYCNKTCNIG